MSRAFVTDKEDWAYCPKAGERCMHAIAGHTCRESGCEFFDREIDLPADSSASVKIVKRQPTKAKAAATTSKTTAPNRSAERRPTKKSKLPKPRKWGGRSDFKFPR